LFAEPRRIYTFVTLFVGVITVLIAILAYDPTRQNTGYVWLFPALSVIIAAIVGEVCFRSSMKDYVRKAQRFEEATTEALEAMHSPSPAACGDDRNGVALPTFVKRAATRHDVVVLATLLERASCERLRFHTGDLLLTSKRTALDGWAALEFAPKLPLGSEAPDSAWTTTHSQVATLLSGLLSGNVSEWSERYRGGTKLELGISSELEHTAISVHPASKESAVDLVFLALARSDLAIASNSLTAARVWLERCARILDSARSLRFHSVLIYGLSADEAQLALGMLTCTDELKRQLRESRPPLDVRGIRLCITNVDHPRVRGLDRATEPAVDVVIPGSCATAEELVASIQTCCVIEERF
jgi:hypothetical protein